MSGLTFEQFTIQLTDNLQKELPGWKAQLKMAAPSRAVSQESPNKFTRRSAILMLFYPYQDQIYLPLILRTVYHGAHAGQIAFPGGRFENIDRNLIRTALREAQEEIGLRLNDVKVLGTLSELYIPVSNFLVQPVVATIPYKPDFYPDPREVADVLEVNVQELFDSTNRKNNEFEMAGRKISAPHYEIQNHFVWGATAMMISELQEVFH